MERIGFCTFGQNNQLPLMIDAISPVDGRYESKTKELQLYFSESALIRYRVFVELQYFKALVEFQLPQLKDFDKDHFLKMDAIFQQFSSADADKVKQIETKTNHDVKAVEYFIRDRFDEIGIGDYKEFIHFALTSQDINNTAFPLMIKQAFIQVYLPILEQVIKKIQELADKWYDIPMLARTHGQPASPTRLGKELMVFLERLNDQVHHLKNLPIKAKFGGATGNFNAHVAAYPQRDWISFGNYFVEHYLGLKRSHYTTQIAHYDHLAAFFHAMARINTILIDLCRDIWTYISMDYFGQKVIEGEVGSSAMPHKVNPIDFENAEGNLSMANAILNFLAGKLPVSRLQRDLTDSTVLRNVGLPFAYSIIAFKSIEKGLGKLKLNKEVLDLDLENNWVIVAEGIQNILRREGVSDPYDLLKSFTRGKGKLDRSAMMDFIEGLDVSEDIKEELRAITPFNYTGIN